MQPVCGATSAAVRRFKSGYKTVKHLQSASIVVHNSEISPLWEMSFFFFSCGNIYCCLGTDPTA